MKLQVIGFDFRLKGEHIVSADVDLFPRDEAVTSKVQALGLACENAFELLSLNSGHGLSSLKINKKSHHQLVAICIALNDTSKLFRHTGYKQPELHIETNLENLIGYDLCDMNGIFSCLSLSEIREKLPDPNTTSWHASRMLLEKYRILADKLVSEHSPHYIVYILEL